MALARRYIELRRQRCCSGAGCIHKPSGGDTISIFEFNAVFVYFSCPRTNLQYCTLLCRLIDKKPRGRKLVDNAVAPNEQSARQPLTKIWFGLAQGFFIKNFGGYSARCVKLIFS